MSESIDTVAPAPDPDPPPAANLSRHGHQVLNRVPALLAIVFFLAFSIVVLSRPEKMIEPDPYAYRASIAALEEGNLTLDQQQYDALSLQLQATSLGGGIMQWHQNADGKWVSEKNPGYPFLAVGFDEIGAIRLAPLFYGALACLALWLGARRWLGRWGGTFAVGAYCSTALAMVMAWRSTMPTFTDASLVAAGLGLLIWSVVAMDRTSRARTIVGSLAFFSFGLAVFVRYTNIVVLAVAAVFALVFCLRSTWRLGRTTLIWWALAAIPPLIAGLAYNAIVFDGPFSTGYAASSVQFSAGAIPDNLRLMPGRLWQAMPVYVLGLAAILVLLTLQIITAMRSRRTASPTDSTGSVANPVEDADSITVTNESEPNGPGTAVPRTIIDRWIGALLVVSWAAVWATYAAYEWTTRMGGGPGSSGGRGGPNGVIGAIGGAIAPMGGAMSGSTHTVYSTVRFYLPALGAIALLVAWLLTRLPAVIGVIALVALFLFGAHEFLDVSGSSWAATPIGGGPNAPSGEMRPVAPGDIGGLGGLGGPGGPGGNGPNLNGPNAPGARPGGSGTPPTGGGGTAPQPPSSGATP